MFNFNESKYSQDYMLVLIFWNNYGSPLHFRNLSAGRLMNILLMKMKIWKVSYSTGAVWLQYRYVHRQWSRC